MAEVSEWDRAKVAVIECQQSKNAKPFRRRYETGIGNTDFQIRATVAA
ncbi:MAG TPA: hypothetical protein VKU02_17945 [Gemmataceae bacterium]|nr:hypothetical protein [Gemmataceae bacterium]